MLTRPMRAGTTLAPDSPAPAASGRPRADLSCASIRKAISLRAVFIRRDAEPPSPPTLAAHDRTPEEATMGHNTGRATPTIAAALCALVLWPLAVQAGDTTAPGSNPLFRDRFTADPAPLVVDDRLYLYVGHDQARGEEMFNMREWLVYST